jgi:hypothetical protein
MVGRRISCRWRSIRGSGRRALLLWSPCCYGLLLFDNSRLVSRSPFLLSCSSWFRWPPLFSLANLFRHRGSRVSSSFFLALFLWLGLHEAAYSAAAAPNVLKPLQGTRARGRWIVCSDWRRGVGMPNSAAVRLSAPGSF